MESPDDWIKRNTEEVNARRLEKLKKATGIVSASPVIQEALRIAASRDNVEAVAFIQRVNLAMGGAGGMFVERALLDGSLSEKEWDDLQRKGFDLVTMCTVLTAYYTKKDGTIPGDEPIVILTTKGGAIHKNKDFLMKRFGIGVMTTEEFSANLEKDPKFKEWEKKTYGRNY